MPQLTGTRRIADNLYLLAHDDATGKPFLQSRALGAGLAGGLLAELLFAGVIWVQADGTVCPRRDLPDDDLPDDYLGAYVLGLLQDEGYWHPLRDWLLFLGATAEENVARRLARAGYVAEVSARRPWRRHRWMPADPDCAFAPLIRVKAVMTRTRSATIADLVLTGLAMACGLGPRVLPFGPPDARHTVETAVRKLHPGLRELIAQWRAG